jgi:hypothetical protein
VVIRKKKLNKCPVVSPKYSYNIYKYLECTTTSSNLKSKKTNNSGVVCMDEKKEKCVLCGVDTNVEEHEHIANRSHYVDGCGQVCCNCYFKVFGKNIVDRSHRTGL